MQPYKALFPNAHLLLPNTELRAAQVMVLPTGQCISKSDINMICKIIKSALGQAHNVKQAI